MIKEAPKPRKIIDWESVETQYRIGIRSLKDIGLEFGVSDAAIIKRARRDSWVRDLKAKIQAKAEAKVSASLVSDRVSPLTAANERQIIEAGSDAIVRVSLAQRKRITRHSEALEKLQEELEASTDDLAVRVDISKKMSDILKTLTALEREAYSIGPAPAAPPPAPPAFDYNQLTPATLRELRKAAADATAEPS